MATYRYLSEFVCSINLLITRSELFDFDDILSFYFQVRMLSYISGNSVPRANLIVLDKLMSSRHELAEVTLSSFVLLSFIS